VAPRWDRGTTTRKRLELTDAERSVTVELLGDASADVRSVAFEVMRELPLREDEVSRLIDLLGRKPGDLRTGALARLRTLDDPGLLAAAERLLADASSLRRLAGLELLRDAIESERATERARARVARYAAEHPTLGDEERAHITAAAGDSTDTASGEVRLLVESVPIDFGPRKSEDITTGDTAVPLADVWKSWARERPDHLRDGDGLELLRAVMADQAAPAWKSSSVERLRGIGQWSRGIHLLRGLLEWCIAWDPPTGVADFLLDGLEGSIAVLDSADYHAMEEERARRVGVYYSYYYVERKPAFQVKLERAEEWLRRARWWRKLFPASMQAAHAERLYGLLRAFESRSRGFAALRLTLDDFVDVYEAGVAGDAEFLDLLVGQWSMQPRSTLLREVSTRKTPRALAEHPELLALVDQARRRVVEVEIQRGDRASAASSHAMALRATGGLDTLARALPALGKAHFARHFGWNYDIPSRQETLSHLVVRSVPRDEDTPDAFARWARDSRLREARLVELAVYAPQWAAHVNHVLQWSGLEGGVWWIQAHTKGDRSWHLEEMKEIWAAEVSERTPLSAADLTEGAVDVAWFAEVYGRLGPERWKALDTAARYASSSGGHTRAQLERYERLQSFRRESRRFGSQRQQSEARAVAIAMANLARTAGYRDVQRLQWAMERDTVADLARGPVVLTRDEVTVELSIDADGLPALRVSRGGRALKALPAALKKDEEVSALKARLQVLKKQRSRVRDALEEAMCRGDRFPAAELRELLEHPILAPSLGRLVLVGDGIAGYPAEGGHALRDHAGELHALGTDEEVRIAHPVDLFARGDWSAWQRECFLAERVQPFKQLFRELYPVTDGERGSDRTRRYAGHQVNPRQALALLSGRGWVARPEEGVSRTFHDVGLTARLGFQEAFYTPADVEGLTLEEVIFTRKGEWEQLAIDTIPARLFSEAMRDLDLVVSVAHRGGVDPEATASTVEMRAALLRETCDLLGLDNVDVQSHHAIIRGKLGEYTVHLGSAGAMLLPGTFLPIVAVHSQHRGRLFLPFADDDPRTAEVMSKVLLLARDGEIRDPNILEWIRAGQGGGVG